MKNFFKKIINEKVDSPYHYASNEILDKNPFGDNRYHAFSHSQIIENDYEEIQNKKKKLNSPYKITSKSLKLEYNKKLSYLDKYLKRILIFSILIIFNSIFIAKVFVLSDLNLFIIILSSISMAIVLLLLFNIKTNVLLDLYGYSSFFLFSMFESCLLGILYLLIIINFIFTCQLIAKNNNCSAKNSVRYFCWDNRAYFLIIFLNICIFFGILMLIKYTINSFWEAFKVLILKQKTTVQKQYEINERAQASKIEFEDEDNNINNESTNRIITNNSEIKLDSADNLKTE